MHKMVGGGMDLCLEFTSFSRFFLLSWFVLSGYSGVVSSRRLGKRFYQPRWVNLAQYGVRELSTSCIASHGKIGGGWGDIPFSFETSLVREAFCFRF